MENCDKILGCRKTLKMYFGSNYIEATGSTVKVDDVLLKANKGYLKGAILIERSAEFIKLRFSDGVKVKWSIDSLKAFVNVEEQYRGKVAGLCGNFNSNQKNDYVLRDFKTYADDIYMFANNWKTDSSVSSLKIESDSLNYLKINCLNSVC